MCTVTITKAMETALENPIKGIGQAFGGTARDILNVGQGGDDRLGDKVVGGASKLMAMGEASGIPLLDTASKYSNQLVTGQDLDDMPTMLIGPDNLPDIANLANIEEDEELSLAAQRARYREDERNRYRGQAGTILTGPQGTSGGSNVPSLSGRRLTLLGRRRGWR